VGEKESVFGGGGVGGGGGGKKIRGGGGGGGGGIKTPMYITRRKAKPGAPLLNSRDQLCSFQPLV